MITLSFNIAIYTLVFFVVGMIKPEFILFFMKQPNRTTITVFTVILAMVCLTLYGEGVRENRQETEMTTRQELPQADVPKK
jgi:uncharacterized membrane protein YidH (DUF202 family)